jgi:hypothetical protein
MKLKGIGKHSSLFRWATITPVKSFIAHIDLPELKDVRDKIVDFKQNKYLELKIAPLIII